MIAQSVGQGTENAEARGTKPLPGKMSFLSFNLHDTPLLDADVNHMCRISDHVRCNLKIFEEQK